MSSEIVAVPVPVQSNAVPESDDVNNVSNEDNATLEKILTALQEAHATQRDNLKASTELVKAVSSVVSAIVQRLEKQTTREVDQEEGKAIEAAPVESSPKVDAGDETSEETVPAQL